jgi:hypothetical protein
MRSVSTNALGKAKPYAVHWAHVTVNSIFFVIEDNCGGIDSELARTSASPMGQPPLAPLTIRESQRSGPMA